MKNKKAPGQAVVIVTLFVAVIILLSIILINIAKVSDIKTVTSQIADSGALGLASQWSQYCNSLKDTLWRKAHSTSLWGLINISICWNCTDIHCECLNWGLIIPIAAIFLSIVLMPFITPVISAAIVLAVINPLFGEINALMKGGFQSAAALMTEYSAMRESAILSMLQSAHYDKEHAVWDHGVVYKYQYGCQPVANSNTCIPLYYWYDLTDTPVAAQVQGKQRIPRFFAWYWSKRHPRVTEAGLAPLVKDFIDALVEITEFNVWDADKWEYTEVSLKVKAEHITCSGADCPEWAVPEKQIVRILSHITTDEKSIIQNFLDWLNGALGGVNNSGFLPIKFVELTKRLLDVPLYEPIITYASRTHIELPFGWGTLINEYDIREIMVVSEALRGVMLRAVELLNLPVSHRIPSINTWLPLWYNENPDNHGQDIYTRLGILLNGGAMEGRTLRGIRVWISDLRKISGDIDYVIPAANGWNRYGIGETVDGCNTVMCCDPACTDCGCLACLCTYLDCSFDGNYCSACGGPYIPLCEIRDLYHAEPTYGCPLDNRWPGCCEDCSERDDCPEACLFQGALLPWGHGPNEVAQAIELLENLVAALEDLQDAIKTLYDEAQKIMYPDAATQQLQKEAIYGWVPEGTGDIRVLNIVRVNLDNYPARNLLPYIEETYGFFGFTKIWDIRGQTNGSVGDVTVSRYTNDISVGSWWTLRYRKDPAAPEWNPGALSGIIHNIQDTGNPGSAADGLATYGISSSANGHYGMNKSDISITRRH